MMSNLSYQICLAPISAANDENIKFKIVLQNLSNITCRLTCCHVPFKLSAFFCSKNIVPFRGLVRVTARSYPLRG